MIPACKNLNLDELTQWSLQPSNTLATTKTFHLISFGIGHTDACLWVNVCNCMFSILYLYLKDKCLYNN